jgi:hypothetical protein
MIVVVIVVIVDDEDEDDKDVDDDVGMVDTIFDRSKDHVLVRVLNAVRILATNN